MLELTAIDLSLMFRLAALGFCLFLAGLSLHRDSHYLFWSAVGSVFWIASLLVTNFAARGLIDRPIGTDMNALLSFVALIITAAVAMTYWRDDNQQHHI